MRQWTGCVTLLAVASVTIKQQVGMSSCSMSAMQYITERIHAQWWWKLERPTLLLKDLGLVLAATTCNTPAGSSSIGTCSATANNGAYPASLSLFCDVDENLGPSIGLVEVEFDTDPPNTPAYGRICTQDATCYDTTGSPLFCRTNGLASFSCAAFAPLSCSWIGDLTLWCFSITHVTELPLNMNTLLCWGQKIRMNSNV